MGNKSSRPPPLRPPPSCRSNLRTDEFPPDLTVAPSWRDLESAAPLDPLELIASEAGGRSGTANGKHSLYEAWEIAMAWQEPLLNKVCLVKECQGPKTSMIQNIAWIRFKVRLDDHAGVSAARAAASGQENPVFWKCVFSEYCKRLESSDFDRADNGIVYSLDDSVEFFNQPGREFPRYMVDGGSVMASAKDDWVSGLRLFVGFGDEDVDPSVKTKLDQLTKRMDSFNPNKQMHRCVDVCLDRLSSEGLPCLCDIVPTTLDELKTNQSDQSDTSSLVAPTHQFRLAQLNFDESFKLSADADVEHLCELMTSSPMEIGPLHVNISEDATISISSRAKLVRSLLGLDPTQAKTTLIRLMKHTDAVLECFLSALPHATSAHTFCFDANKLDDHDLPWLAYVMFHPDTPQSSWKALEVGDIQFSRESVTVMESMARGNNLEALLHGISATYTTYCSATLVPAVVVKTKPSSLAETIVQGCDITARVDVSLTSTSENPFAWKRW